MNKHLPQEKKEANKKAELERRLAQGRKEVNRKKMEGDHQISLPRNEAKRKQVKLEQPIDQRKHSNRLKVQ